MPCGLRSEERGCDDERWKRRRREPGVITRPGEVPSSDNAPGREKSFRLIRDSGVLSEDRSGSPTGPCPAFGRCAQTRRSPGTTAAAPGRSLDEDGANCVTATRTLPPC